MMEVECLMGIFDRRMETMTESFLKKFRESQQVHSEKDL